MDGSIGRGIERVEEKIGQTGSWVNTYTDVQAGEQTIVIMEDLAEAWVNEWGKHRRIIR